MCSKDPAAIVADGISKYFEIYEKPSHRLLQMIFRGRRRYYRPFWALSDISFTVERGECVGIIGRNGAGKSTLLQIVTGTLNPSAGQVTVRGRVAALLELGSGFNPEFTGRENVYLNASILGLTRAEIDARYDDIVAFADIGEFVNQPVKSYSSGMVVRLAFAVVAHVDADVLIVDEALAVGDAFFTQKCMRFLRRFMETNTVLFVSHDASAVNSLCNRALLLENGRIKVIGSPKEVTDLYMQDRYESMQGKSVPPPIAVLPVPEETPAIPVIPATPEIHETPETPALSDPPVSAVSGLSAASAEVFPNCCQGDPPRDFRQDFMNANGLRNDIQVFRFNPDGPGFGKGGCTITDVRLTDESGALLTWVAGGEMVSLHVTTLPHEPLYSPIVGFHFNDRTGQILFGDNTFLTHRDAPLHLEPGEVFTAGFTFRMPILRQGDYSIAVAVAEGTQLEHVQQQWRNDALLITSVSDSPCTGLMGIPMKNIILHRLTATASAQGEVHGR